MGLGSELKHADREGPFQYYCAGLLATAGRRSVEPMPVVTDPGHVSKQHQKPRGAPDPAAAPRPQLDCYDPSRIDRRDCKQTSPMPARLAQAVQTQSPNGFS
jgi:hypothetical protein